ncbi:hypothetical protein ACE6H2_022798 [Prunus campanulata]
MAQSREEHHIPTTTTNVATAATIEIETKHQPPTQSREEHHIPTTTTSVAAVAAIEMETKHQPPSITTLLMRDTIQRHYYHRHRDKDNTSHLEQYKNNQTKQINKHI